MLDLRCSLLQTELLGRPPHPMRDESTRERIGSQRVLVTGAGGSVGSELARRLAECAPVRLTLVDQSEYQLFRIQSELRDRHPGVDTEACLADVTQRRALQRVFRTSAPEVVYHVAAYKHVGMTERNVCAAVQTNVLGSVFAVQAAAECDADFVLVSTDKAARPRSVMGASKRLAEVLVLLTRSPARTSAVRFGNVLGSSGSVVEIILDRIARGRPIQITHPDAARFFMTVAEAAALVLSSHTVSPARAIYWQDMGQPVKVVDLAGRMLEAAARQGARRVPIEFIGLRPGERLGEEFPTSELVRCEGAGAALWRLRDPVPPLEEPERLVRDLHRDVVRGDARRSLRRLMIAVPEFSPSPTALRAAGLGGVVSRRLAVEVHASPRTVLGRVAASTAAPPPFTMPCWSGRLASPSAQPRADAVAPRDTGNSRRDGNVPESVDLLKK